MDLSSISDEIHRRLDQRMAAREKALSASRRSIRSSSNAIRAIHRGEFEEASRRMEESAAALAEGRREVEGVHPEIHYAGYLQDAEKEYAEARLTEAMVAGVEPPDVEAVGVGLGPYLNGMAESIGEGRRAILDLLRGGSVDQAERILGEMEDMYHVLVSMDYPDAVTGNLRRSTDVARSIIEKTRGDLSISIVQRDLRDALERHADEMRGSKDST